jgi:hypothetical protein
MKQIKTELFMEIIYLEQGVQSLLDEGKTQFFPVLIKIRELKDSILKI